MRWLAVCALLLTATAGNAAEPTLPEAEALVRRGRFDDAIVLLKDLLYPARVKGKELKNARAALAQAYFHTGKLELARHELQLLLKTFPTTKPDADLLPPDFFAFFSAERDAIIGKKQAKTASQRDAPPATPQKAPPAETPTTAVSAAASAPSSAPTTIVVVPATAKSESPTHSSSAPISIETVYTPAPWYLKILPLGIGQFANGDPAGGAGWLVSELVLIGANIGLAAFNETQFRNGYPRTELYPALYWAQLGSAIGAYVLGAFGVLDAFLWSPGRARARTMRR